MKKITIIGGDNRMKILKACLERDGYIIDSYGLFPDDFADISTSRVIILPVPTTKDRVNVFCPLTGKKIPLSYVEENTGREQLILCCNYLFENRSCIDYGGLDSYALLNSVPTAEGAIRLAIENTDFTLWKSKVLVIGYGRVGKILCDRLRALGCWVTVSARKSADFAMLDALCYDYISTESLKHSELDFDIIFNTVDACVIDNKALKSCKAKLMLDLSSSGGFDIDAAEELGIRAIKAAGLPSVVAPKTAAEILQNTISHILNSYN